MGSGNRAQSRDFLGSLGQNVLLVPAGLCPFPRGLRAWWGSMHSLPRRVSRAGLGRAAAGLPWLPPSLVGRLPVSVCLPVSPFA